MNNTSATKAWKQFQRNGLCQHSLCHHDRSTEKNMHGRLGPVHWDPASLAPGHARAKAHQGSCLTDAVTSAVEVRLTPVYSPSWPEYLRLLLSGLVLSPGPDITDELAWKGREEQREQMSFARTRVWVGKQQALCTATMPGFLWKATAFPLLALVP